VSCVTGSLLGGTLPTHLQTEGACHDGEPCRTPLDCTCRNASCQESKALIGTDRHFRKYYVLGRVTRLHGAEAAGSASAAGDKEPVAGSLCNPYKLPNGTQFFVLTVEPLGDV
jgi:hypothetical protein